MVKNTNPSETAWSFKLTMLSPISDKNNAKNLRGARLQQYQHDDASPVCKSRLSTNGIGMRTWTH